MGGKSFFVDVSRGICGMICVEHMAKTKKTSRAPKWAWYLLAVTAVFLAAPNGTLIKTVSAEIAPVWINVLRFSIVAVAMLPFVLHALPRMKWRNLRYALLAGVFYAIAVTGYVLAISLSQASYVAVIGLAIPIMLIVYSVYLTRERVSHRAVFGIGVAALGGFTIMGLPLMIGQGFASEFNPLATVLALAQCLAFPLAVIFSRLANEKGLPLAATFGISSTVVTTVALGIALLSLEPFPYRLLDQPPLLMAILYSALCVSLLARLLTVASYRHVGSAAIAGLQYGESFLAILLPIILLGERMTQEMLIGGTLIILGIIIAEAHHHPSVHHHNRAGHRHI